MESAMVGRRRFVNWFLGTSLGALTVSVIYPILRYVSPPRIAEASTNSIDAGPVNDPVLLEKGFKVVRFGAEPVILVKAGENDFRAFTATCTHLDCVVGYQKDKTRLFCNCHGGAYDLNGQVTGGPPPKPLTPFKVNLAQKGSGQPATIVISKA